MKALTLGRGSQRKPFGEDFGTLSHHFNSRPAAAEPPMANRQFLKLYVISSWQRLFRIEACSEAVTSRQLVRDPARSVSGRWYRQFATDFSHHLLIYRIICRRRQMITWSITSIFSFPYYEINMICKINLLSSFSGLKSFLPFFDVWWNNFKLIESFDFFS